MEHFVYLADSASLATAERFLSRAEASFDVLAGQPLIGAPLRLRHPDLAGMRKWRVKDFDTHLIFYLPRHDGGRHRARTASGAGLVEPAWNRELERQDERSCVRCAAKERRESQETSRLRWRAGWLVAGAGRLSPRPCP